ncbi:MAG: hypothetical protein ABR511_04000 [Acidimicrobiales bacterium]
MARWPAAARHGVGLGCAAVAAAVVAFSGGWAGGRLVLDGPGASLWVRIALDHWWHGGVPYWIPNLWAGTPAWALAPTFPVLSVLPIGILVGPEEAVKLAALAAQVVGAWGVIVLARALWRNTVAAVVAGFVYALHPLLVSHVALAGHQPSVWVMAATPWLVWCFRQAMGAAGRRWVVLTGILAGFALLEQPEHVYGLVVLAACILVVELTGQHRRPGRWRAVAGRTMAMGVVAGGVAAYWLFPFLSLSTSFVLTPPTVARQSLVEGVGSTVGHAPSLFLTRAARLSGSVDFARVDFLKAGGFYLGWVCVALTLVTVVVAARRDRDGYLTAILLASVLALWTSTGGVPLSASALASGGLVAFLMMGAVCGVLAGALLGRSRRRRVAVMAGVVVAGLLVAAPYVAPFLTLQRVVPLLRSVRFPRLYPIAVLGLALGTAYPLTVLREWAGRRAPSLAGRLTLAVALAVAGAFLVDASPYRSFYRVHPPPSGAAYRQASASLAAAGGNFRIAGSLDPSSVNGMLSTGHEVTVGWPHPVASKDVWRLTFEALAATPPGFRDAALGLSGTAYLALEHPSQSSPASTVVDGVTLDRNAKALPLARAYEQAVVVRDGAVAPELAVALSQRGIGVVVGGQADARSLGDATRAVAPATTLCRAGTEATATGDGAINSQVATACAIHQWAGLFDGIGTASTDQGAGAVFRTELQPLRGLSVWLDRDPRASQLVLRTLADDGRTPGRVVATATVAGLDDNGMAVFPLDPALTEPGRRYVFTVSCPVCSPGQSPRLVVTDAERGPGDLVLAGALPGGRVAGFTPLYDHLSPAPAPAVGLTATSTGPGRWTLDSSGPRPSLLVVADAWFPGWTARVDGRPATVLEADGAFLGVAVGPGHHHVTLAYQGPASAAVGRAVSVATLVVCALVLAWPHRRRRPTAGPAGGDAAGWPHLAPTAATDGGDGGGGSVSRRLRPGGSPGAGGGVPPPPPGRRPRPLRWSRRRPATGREGPAR